jgi:hypothetical protein
MSVPQLELAFSTELVSGWRVWRVCREIDGAQSAPELALRLLEAEERGEDRPVAQLFRHRLRSLTEQGFWAPRQRLEARCVHEGAAHGPAPSVECECGAWAFRSAARANEVVTAYAEAGTALAVGRVWLWGRIVEHDDGWRAQFAYPRDVTLHGAGVDTVDDVRAAYGIPVELAPPRALRPAA